MSRFDKLLKKITGVEDTEKAINWVKKSWDKGKKQFKADTSDEDAAALDYITKSSDVFNNLSQPDLQTPSFNKYSNVSNYDPATVQTSLAGPTAYGDISVDPRLAGDQTASLDALAAIASGGGLTAADRARLSQVQSEAAQADRGRREAILQQQAARGMSGSGNELLAQLQSSQAATDRSSQAGLDIAGMAQQRAMDAIIQRGQLAGNVRGQAFGEQAQKAAASDAIARFNAANVNTGAQAGADRETEARRFAAQGAQAASDKTTAGLNEQETQSKISIPQQKYDNALSAAAAQAGGLDKLANYQTMLGDRKTRNKEFMTTGLLGAASEGLKAYYSGGASTAKK